MLEIYILCVVKCRKCVRGRDEKWAYKERKNEKIMTIGFLNFLFLARYVLAVNIMMNNKCVEFYTSFPYGTTIQKCGA